MKLRPYQEEARRAIESEWHEGRAKTLLVLPTGTGKTVCFSAVAADRVERGDRVLIMAHRGELLEQAADKLKAATGLASALEKAESSCLDNPFARVVVGSVQTLMRESRLERFPRDYFRTIIIDEAHHAVSQSYQNVLSYFDGARVLGVTATADRADMKDLGSVFDSLAYEYTLPRAIKDGYLSPIKAQTIPLKLDISKVAMSAGDFKASDVDDALEPYLESIADEMRNYCKGRRTVVFLPLVATSQKFRDILNARGFRAAEVNGESKDRAEILRDFAAGKYDVLCNSMLLTEGWDCPAVDCVVVLRPTKSRALYCLDEETEVLTQNGWKKNVDIGEMIATFSIKSEKIEFHPAIATVRRNLEKDEYFLHLDGQSSDIRVTNHHRMIYDNKRRIGWKIKEAEEVANLSDGCYIPASAKNDFCGVPLTDDELKFIGWVMTDGTINKANNAITITQGTQQPWLEEIQKCIDGCNMKYGRREIEYDSQFNTENKKVIWTISKGKPRGSDKDKRGWGYLEKYISKDFSQALFDMTERQFDIMLETIHLGDGSKQENQSWTRRSYHISKGNKTFIERLQIMGIMRGWRCSISTQNYNKNPLYTIHMKKTNFIRVGSSSGKHATWMKEPANKNEKCWCVETKAGTIVTRRHGKVAFMGNCQMVGRGTRLSPGKKELLLLDFLWMTERHELCRPAHLLAKDKDVAAAMTKRIEESAEPQDLEDVERQANEDVVREREESLAKQLAQMKKRKRKLVDPLQFEMSIQAEDLTNYVPAFGWELNPVSEKQKATLERSGIFPDEITCAGKAQQVIDRLAKRRAAGLTTPKQIRFLESKGFMHVGTWSFEAASNMIARISANGWRTPHGVTPSTYKPEV